MACDDLTAPLLLATLTETGARPAEDMGRNEAAGRADALLARLQDCEGKTYHIL